MEGGIEAQARASRAPDRLVDGPAWSTDTGAAATVRAHTSTSGKNRPTRRDPPELRKPARARRVISQTSQPTVRDAARGIGHARRHICRAG
jgi:hypothetical protein